MMGPLMPSPLHQVLPDPFTFISHVSRVCVCDDVSCRCTINISPIIDHHMQSQVAFWILRYIRVYKMIIYSTRNIINHYFVGRITIAKSTIVPKSREEKICLSLTLRIYSLSFSKRGYVSRSLPWASVVIRTHTGYHTKHTHVHILTTRWSTYI